MGLLEWLRDGFLSDRAHYRRTSERLSRRVEIGSLRDPSGPHHFGRRAHHTDPNGHYGFEGDAYHRKGDQHSAS